MWKKIVYLPVLEYGIEVDPMIGEKNPHTCQDSKRIETMPNICRKILMPKMSYVALMLIETI